MRFSNLLDQKIQNLVLNFILYNWSLPPTSSDNLTCCSTISHHNITDIKTRIKIPLILPELLAISGSGTRLPPESKNWSKFSTKAATHSSTALRGPRQRKMVLWNSRRSNLKFFVSLIIFDLCVFCIVSQFFSYSKPDFIIFYIILHNSHLSPICALADFLSSRIFRSPTWNLQFGK